MKGGKKLFQCASLILLYLSEALSEECYSSTTTVFVTPSDVQLKIYVDESGSTLKEDYSRDLSHLTTTPGFNNFQPEPTASAEIKNSRLRGGPEFGAPTTSCPPPPPPQCCMINTSKLAEDVNDDAFPASTTIDFKTKTVDDTNTHSNDYQQSETTILFSSKETYTEGGSDASTTKVIDFGEEPADDENVDNTALMAPAPDSKNDDTPVKAPEDIPEEQPEDAGEDSKSTETGGADIREFDRPVTEPIAGNNSLDVDKPAGSDTPMYGDAPDQSNAPTGDETPANTDNPTSGDKPKDDNEAPENDAPNSNEEPSNNVYPDDENKADLAKVDDNASEPPSSEPEANHEDNSALKHSDTQPTATELGNSISISSAPKPSATTIEDKPVETPDSEGYPESLPDLNLSDKDLDIGG